MEDIRKIILLRFSSLGDIVLTSSVTKALKERYPKAELFYVTKKEYIELVKLLPNVDHILYLDSRYKMKALLKLIRRINLEKVDLLFDLHRSLRSIIIYLFSSPKYKIHYSKHRFKRFLRIFFKFEIFSKNNHEIDYYFEPLKRLGITPTNRDPELNLNSELEKRIEVKFNLNRVRLLIGICPGAKLNTRRWSVEKFAQLGDRLIERLNAKVLLLGGSEEILIGERIKNLMKNKSINLIGKTSLQEFVGVIKHCDLIITHDSSPLHIAVSLKIPSVSIFGPTTPDLGFGPYGEGRNIVLERDLICRPCSAHGEKSCFKESPLCMELITVNEVFLAAEKLLSEKDISYSDSIYR